MNKTPEKPQDSPEQSKRFEETARQLEADESGKRFERAVGVVVKLTPQPNSDEPLTPKATQTIVVNKDGKRPKGKR